MNEFTYVRDSDVTALRCELERLEMLVEGLVEAAEEVTRERDELRSYIVACTRLEMDGSVASKLEQFRTASELPAVKETIAATLKEGVKTVPTAELELDPTHQAQPAQEVESDTSIRGMEI